MSKNRILVVETRLQHWSGHVNFQGLPQVEAPFCAPHSLTWLRRALPPPNMPTSRSMQSFANCWELSATGPICLYRGENVMLSTILIIILILLLIGALPTWPYSAGWGYYPGGGLGLILIIVIILVLMGRI
jgi:hypothetical protein